MSASSRDVRDTGERTLPAGIRLDDLPVGVLRVDAADRILEANTAFAAWAGADVVIGRPLAGLLADTEDFLDDSGHSMRMMASTADPGRVAFVLRHPLRDGWVVTVVDATERLAAGRRLQRSLALGARTRSRLELVIGASIEFSTATSEERLAEILALTSARAYQAEQSAVFLLDADGNYHRAAGELPFDGAIDAEALAQSAGALQGVLKVSAPHEVEDFAPALAAGMRTSGVEAMIAAPIHHDAERLGVFACFFFHPRQFDDEAAPLADALAGQAGQTLTSLRLQRRLEESAMHDETTGLPNRRLLDARAPSLLESGGASVIFLDLDGFKAVNDGLGHDFGDVVLREVGHRLRAAVRDEDAVARFGGDEFVVISGAADEDEALAVAERLRVAIETPFDMLPNGMSLSASIGIAVGSPGDRPLSIDRMIRAADQAMYRAKSSGGNRTEVART